MNSRRPSNARGSMSMRSFDDGDLTSFTSRFSVRPSTLIRPSMHSEYMQRSELADAPPGTRRRSLSTESDRSGKHRPSVPLLYASTISSMSTLSSSFYQYDSTGAVLPEIAPTPASSKDSSDHHSRHNGSKQASQDPTLRLPPVQQRMIRKDAYRMTRELIVEQVYALEMTRKSAVIKRSAALGSVVADVKGVKVFEKAGLGSSLQRSKKNNVKRYTAQWQLNGTMDEIVELLQRDDDRMENYMSCQSVLSPETVNCKLLWRDDHLKDPSQQQARSGDDDEDDSPVISIEPPEEDEFMMFSEHGGAKNIPRRHPRPPSGISTKSKASSSSRRGYRNQSKALNWLGVNWWVQHMPLKLSRDRDFIVLENQREFEMPSSGSKGPLRRGFVHMRHSVDLADMAPTEKKLLSPFVRGLIIQSGLVVVESDEPGVLDVASTLEIDCGGHLSAGQHRQIVVKRLQSQLESLSDMLWKLRLLKTQRLFGPTMPRLDKKSSDSQANRCHRCQYKPSRWGPRRTMEPCRSCEHVVCANCSTHTDFQPFLVAAALPTRRQNVQSVDSGDLKARVCSHCVVDFSRPRLARHQSSADTYSAEIDDHFDLGDDDEHYNERTDAVRSAMPPSFHNRKHYQANLSTRRSSTSIHDDQDWHPSRSSRIAEDLVDDFLTSFKADSTALPEYLLASPGPLSPSALSDSEPQFEPEPLSPPVPQAAPDANPMTASGLQRHVSRADGVRRPSVSSYTPLQGHDIAPPRRKLSIFETIPEPAPRKNVVLYEM